MAIVLLFTLLAQDPGAAWQREIDRAVRNGTDYLKTAPSPGPFPNTNCDEFILLTLLVAGIPDTNPRVDELLHGCLRAPLTGTYKVALLAMALEELDPSLYQVKMAQCAQFLVDNQAKNGQWSYGAPTDLKKFPFEDTKKKVETGSKRGEARVLGSTRKEKKKPARPIDIAQQRLQGDSGDNSSSQYAALGLRACHDANIRLPLDVLDLARRWWIESQWPDEAPNKVGKNAVASGSDTTRIQGWTYQKPGDGSLGATDAMTAGAVGALVIYEYMMGRDFKKDAVTKAGVNWLGKHFTVNDNLYYMYAVERAGMLYDTVLFGDHDWYREGARRLLETQKPDGSWGNKVDKPEQNTWDTCFAILFLKKATRAVATESAGSRR